MLGRLEGTSRVRRRALKLNEKEGARGQREFLGYVFQSKEEEDDTYENQSTKNQREKLFERSFSRGPEEGEEVSEGDGGSEAS